MTKEPTNALKAVVLATKIQDSKVHRTPHVKVAVEGIPFGRMDPAEHLAERNSVIPRDRPECPTAGDVTRNVADEAGYKDDYDESKCSTCAASSLAIYLCQWESSRRPNDSVQVVQSIEDCDQEQQCRYDTDEVLEKYRLRNIAARTW